MRGVLTRLTLCCALASSVSGCVTDGSLAIVNDVARLAGLPVTQYNIFFSPAAHVNQLLDAGKTPEAAAVYAEQKEFFAAKPVEQPTVDRLLRTIRADVQPRYEAAVAGLAALHWPEPPATWSRVERSLREASDAVVAVRRYPLLRDPAFGFAGVEQLQTDIDALARSIVQSAAEVFATYALASEPNFFSAYPVTVDALTFHRDHPELLARYLDFSKPEDLGAILNRYRRQLPAETLNVFPARYYEATLRAQGATGKPDLAAMLAALVATRQAGMELDGLPGVNVALVDVTSRTLVQRQQLAFPLSIKVDVPVTAEKAELDTAFANPIVAEADILIIADVAAAKATRDIAAYDPVRSEYRSGKRSVANPEYATAQAKVTTATINYQRASISAATFQPTGTLFDFVTIGLLAGNEVSQHHRYGHCSLRGWPQRHAKPSFWRSPLSFRTHSERRHLNGLATLSPLSLCASGAGDRRR